MPEICNGLDDDCDGDVDNLSTSWDNQLFSVYDPTELEDFDSDGVDRTAIHCWERDVCSCPGGQQLDHGGPGYEAHVMSWKPNTCTCGEGLSDQASGGFTPAPAAVSDEPQAGCSAAGAGSMAAKLISLVFGMLVLVVCRRRQRE
jgi:hypothetical protein